METEREKYGLSNFTLVIIQCPGNLRGLALDKHSFQFD